MPCLERFGLLCTHQYNVAGVLVHNTPLRAYASFSLSLGVSSLAIIILATRGYIHVDGRS